MAKVTKKTVEITPAKPAVTEERFTLDLSHDEAMGLYAVLAHVRVNDHKSNTYPVFSALADHLDYWDRPKVVSVETGKPHTLRFP